jgi:hypothetical protein
VLVSSF